MGELAKKVISSWGLDPTLEITTNSLIRKTLEEINREYKSGTIAWMKESKPQEWTRVLALEGEVNEAVLKRDIKAVQKALAEYKTLMLAAIREFSVTDESSSPGCLTGKLEAIGAESLNPS